MVIWPSACYITLQIKKMPIKTFSASPLPPSPPHIHRERDRENPFGFEKTSFIEN